MFGVRRQSPRFPLKMAKKLNVSHFVCRIWHLSSDAIELLQHARVKPWQAQLDPRRIVVTSEECNQHNSAETMLAAADNVIDDVEYSLGVACW